MSAIVGVFCPKSQKPINDFENELIRVRADMDSVERIVTAISNSQEYHSSSLDAALDILSSQAQKVDGIMNSVSEELSKINQKRCFGVAFDSQRFYTILMSGGDSLLTITGLVLAATGDTKEKIVGGVLASAGQIFSKINDIISTRREKELIRKCLLEEYYFSSGAMKSSISSLQSSLGLFIRYSDDKLIRSGVVDEQGSVPFLTGRTSRTNVTPHALKESLTEYKKRMNFHNERSSLLKK